MIGPETRPAELDRLRPIEVDVRNDIRRGEEPFARIMTAARAIEPGEALVVRAPFEPAPLYAVLARRGLTHWTERLAADDWRVWFHRAAAPPAGPAPVAVADGGTTLDVRGLEPPQPMVQVLERLEALEPGGVLTVLHERRPVFLYPQLDARGFRHETDEPEPGLVRIVIRRGAG
ncbi:MAG TPA: DUF2249 domain-containing protein [Methylomirabilota bacterium]|nr:DUF2249 domain-containing protein [Methylomirabilota bacterium]